MTAMFDDKWILSRKKCLMTSCFLCRKKWAKSNRWGRTRSGRLRGEGRRGVESDTEHAPQCQEAPHQEVATEEIIFPNWYRYWQCTLMRFIGLYIPSDLKISLGPRDLPRASPSGHLLGLGKSLGRRGCKAFSHHYQRSIDFNIVNIHLTIGMYFLVSTGNRDDIEWNDPQRS